ncbi:MAG TPA: tubulin-like doman-containing protein [Lacipirellula sp.]
MNPQAEQHELSLPGYTLSTRLGAGGYGEVWLAHAPGGLTKAVKFIFGSFHEKRAEHELKALQRMKDLRHPFLLSLERIEVVDGRLVIVTELAEGSLKDRFDACQRDGLRGIPREELLQYMEDAADALDFLSEKHSLQHLDVKPENLLLVAGHVKVADFGLVKDIGSTQASMVGGLTPLYSAPEVFQGNPSARSDQYSLAVLYQEMLTGVLPFPGVTAAELTLQHLHDDPDMSSLPIADRYVLARALSKDPASRFENCSDFIRALIAAPNDGGSWAAPQPEDVRTTPGFDPVLPERRAERRAGPVTEFFDEKIEQPRKELSASMLLDWESPADMPPRALPPIDLSNVDSTARPTVVIGIGGAAATVLKQFRTRLAKQFGDEPLPAVQMLLLDSDTKTIAQAMQGDARTALQPEETLALPLRRPQEYREQSAKLMRWLSRRWLYNIPKSLRTEGLRPLGRLAFADHARQAVQRIRMAIAKATDAESVETSAKQAGVPFQTGAVRVYVVASISGGAGSGMSLDVGYAVRTALEKAGVADAEIIGLFVHASGRDARQCDLACVNTYAWLTEYNHFHQPGGQFPGDESCGLPPLPPGKRAFDSAYLIDAGAELQTSDFEEAARSLAEYVYLDGFSLAQAFFSACRNEQRLPESGTNAPLRTLRLRRVVAAADASIETAAAQIAREVVLKWSGEHPLQRCGGPSGTSQLVQGAAKFVSHLQLRLEGLASNVRGLIEAQFGGDQQAFIDNLVQMSTQDGPATGPAEMVRIVDCVFAVPKDQPEGHYILQRPLEGIVSPLTMRLAGDLAKWVLQKLDDRQERLAGAQGAAQWLVDHLTKLEVDATKLSAALLKQIAACAELLRRQCSASGAPTDEDWQQAINYFRMRTDHQAVLASALIARRLLSELTTVSTTIMEFGRHVKHLAMNMPSPDRHGAKSDAFTTAVNHHLAALADAVDEQIQAAFIAHNGGLFQTIMGNSRVRAQMLSELSKRARQAAEQLAAQPDIVQTTIAGRSSGDAAESAEPSLPRLLQHGGAYRSLAVLPQQAGAASSQLVASELGPGASVLAGVGSDIVLCTEAWDLPLASVAVDVIQSRRDYADFAARVLTRSDIAWTPLTAPRSSFAPVVGDNAFADAMPTMTQVL